MFLDVKGNDVVRIIKRPTPGPEIRMPMLPARSNSQNSAARNPPKVICYDRGKIGNAVE